MVFSSVIFLTLFFPLVFTIYFLLHNKIKNAFLLLASIVFYMWGAPKFIFAILATTTLDFFLVKMLDGSKAERTRKIFLVLSLSLNVGMLFYFKYCNFFIDNFNAILSSFTDKQIEWTKIILPIGISFYTFESLTYVMDVYRKVHKPLNNFWQYQMYILMFPKLIAGPIIRYHEISDQIEGRLGKENVSDVLAGFYRFVIGLSKKVLIANSMAVIADKVFNAPLQDMNSPYTWLGMFAYTFQIYFDFSGYSDMAIGMGRMLGFRFPENFDNPYTSASITEFWRKWHMTLGSWMKNYLYIPLGGNRVSSNARLYFNLWLVFLLSGFWHGASWNFIFWGVFHGALLVMERVFLLNFYKKTGRIFSVAITFLLVSIGWVFFRMENFSDAIAFIKKLISFDFKTTYIFITNDFIFYLSLAILFSFFALSKKGLSFQDKIYNAKFSTTGYFIGALASVILFFICLSSITSSTFNPFIYFRF